MLNEVFTFFIYVDKVLFCLFLDCVAQENGKTLVFYRSISLKVVKNRNF